MSDLLNKASLVMVPSGYKEDTVYSVVPSDGSGDLSFTRASNGTRVNSAGLVEVCPWNMVEYSEQFDNGVWTTSDVTVTANTTIAPNGTTTADTINAIATGQRINQTISVTASTSYTFSFYAKKGTMTTPRYTVFDLSNSAFILQQVDYSSLINSSSWERVTATFTTPLGCTSIGIYPINGVTTLGTIFLWGAQLNIGSTAKPYFPTTDRLNVPRLTYQNGGGGCPSLLLEKQSTNSQTYSEQIDNAAWGLSSITISANNTTSPDGTQNADKIVETATTARHELYGNSLSFSGNNAVSFYAKYAGRQFLCALGGGGGNGATFDLINGTVATNTAVSASIESVGNGWYRCSVVINFTGTNQMYYILRTTGSVGIETYAGDGTSGVYFWGAQTELNSSYQTSYIPTTSSSATRVADACFKDGLSVFGTNQGTFFVDSIGPKFQTAAQYLFDLSDNAGANRFALYSVANNELSLYTNTGNNFSANVFARNKIAVSWNGTTCKLYMNGTQMLNISCPTSNPTSINLNSRFNDVEFGDSQFNEVVCFPTALTNAELASLTTI